MLAELAVRHLTHLADLRTNAWMKKKHMAMSNVHIENPVVSLLTLFSLHLEQKAMQPDTFVCQEFPSSNFLQQIKLFDDIKLFTLVEISLHKPPEVNFSQD